MAKADAEAKTEGKGGGVAQMAIAGIGIFVIVTVSNVVTSMVMPPRVVVSGGEASASAEDTAAMPPLYHALSPPLIANIDSREADFLQVSIELMARDQAVIDAIGEHEAAIRNNLLMLFAATNGENINSREAKEQLRTQVLEEVQQVLAPFVGERNVEEVYFTSFVAQ